MINAMVKAGPQDVLVPRAINQFASPPQKRKIRTAEQDYDYSCRPEAWSRFSGPHPKDPANLPVFILKEIIRTEIKLDEQLEKENNEILHGFLHNFIDAMKKSDEMFNSLFQRIDFTGSYYSDLRIATPDEFDLNLVLKLPFTAKNIEVQFKEEVASYAKLKFISKYRHSHIESSHDRLLRTFFENDYLIPEKIRNWLQGVVDKALYRCPLPKYCYEVRARTSGPARTIQLMKMDRKMIDIDFVPVIEYTLDGKIPGIDDRIYRKMRSNPVKCFLVPKPYQIADGPYYVDQRECRQLWRMHFPEAENYVIYNFGCVKPIIKLLKLLRDKNNWKSLASYYLKTVVMWLIVDDQQEKNWKEDKMCDKFIETLKKLLVFIEQRNIPYFYSSQHNLIRKMNGSEAVNISNRLIGIIKEIEKDPNKLWGTFNVKPTFTLSR